MRLKKAFWMLGAVVSLGGGVFACASCWPQKTSSLEEVESELNEIEEIETYHTDLVPSETFEINQEVSADDLGITLPPSLDKFTTTLTIDDLDDHTGLVSVRLKLSHESRHIVRNFNVINFAKKTDHDREAVEKWSEYMISANKTLHEQKLPSESCQIGPADFDKIGLNKYDLSHGWEVDLNVVEVDDDEGYVVVEATLKKNGQAKHKQKYKVAGFKNHNTHNKIIVEEIKALLVDQKTKPSNQSLLPSEIDLTEQDTYWENIGGKPWDLEKNNGVDLQYETLKKNDETGAIIVRVTINRGKISDQKVVRIHGFLSKSVYRKSVIDDFFAKALKLRADHGDQKASDILKLGQTDLQKIRINWPTLPDKWRFEATVAKINDVKGSATFLVSVYHEDTNLDGRSVEIGGFLDEINFEKKQLHKLLDSLKDQKVHANWAEQLPSQWREKPDWPLDYQKLNLIFEPIPNLDWKKLSGLVSVVSHDDQKGTIEIKIDFKYGDSTASKTIELSGLKTLQQFDHEIAHQFIQKTKVSQTDKTDILVRDIIKNKPFTPESLGVKWPKLPDHLKLIINMDSYEEDQGRIDLFLELRDADNQVIAQGKSRITGFKTLVEQDQEDVNKVVGLFQDQVTQESNRDKQVSEMFKQGQVVSARALGVKLPSNDQLNGVEVTLRVFSIDDTDGKLTVEVIGKKRNSERRITFVVSGFQNQNERDQSAIAQFLKDWENVKTSTSGLLAKLVAAIFKGELSKLGVENPPQLTGGLEARYEIENFDDDNGIINLRVIISRQGKEIKTAQVKVRGYRTSSEQHLIDIGGIINGLGELTAGERLADKRPSQVFKEGQTAELEDFYIPWPRDIDRAGMKVEVKILELDDEHGQAKVEITVSKGVHSKKRESIISGFDTNERYRQREGQRISDLLTDLKVKTSDKVPSQIFKLGPVGLDEIGFMLPILPFEWKMELKVVEIRDAGGQVGFEATLRWRDTPPLKYRFTVSGFKRQSTKDQEDVEKIAALIKDQTAHASFGQSQLSKIAKVDELVNPSDLGFESPSPEQIGSAKITYRVVKIDDENGELTLEAAIEKGESLERRIFKVTGYQTEKQRDESAIKEFLSAWESVKTTLVTYLPRDAAKMFDASLADLGVDEHPQLPEHFSVKYMIKTFDDESGTITLEAEISKKGQLVQKVTVVVKGFRTTAVQHQLDVSKILELLKEIRVSDKFSQKRPSQVFEIGQKITLEEIDFPWPKTIDRRGVEIELEILTLDDENGEAKVKITVTKGQITDDGERVLTGFDDNSSYQNRVAEQVWKQLENLTTSDQDKTPGSVFKLGEVEADQLGFKQPELPPEWEITWEVLKLDNPGGEVHFEASLKWRDHPAIKHQFVVKGYKKQAQQDQEDVEEIAALVQDQNANDSFRNTQLSKITKVGDLINPADLGFENLDPTKVGDANLTYQVIEIDDSNGEVLIEVKITKGQANTSRQFKVSGFQTEQDRDQLAIKKFLSEWESVQTSRVDLMPNAASKLFGEDLSALGVSSPPLLPTGLDPKYKVKTFDDEQGTINLEVEIYKNGKLLETVEVQISGFRTQAEQNQIDVSAVLDALKSIKIGPKLNEKRAGEIFKLHQIITLADLDAKLPAAIDPRGLSIDLEVLSLDDETGTMKVQVNVSKGQTKNFRETVVSGFETNLEYQARIVKKIWPLLNDRKTIFAKDLASQLFKIGPVEPIDLAILMPLVPIGWKISLSITDIEDKTGTITLEASLRWLKRESFRHTFTLSGFKTRHQQDQDDVKLVLKEIKDWKVSGEFANLRPLDVGNVGEEVDPQKLGLPTVPSAKELNVVLRYIIAEQDNEDGILTLIVRVIKSDAAEEKRILVQGLKTNLAYEKEIVVKLVEQIKKTKTSLRNDVLPSSFAKDQSHSAEEIGLKMPKLPAGWTAEFVPLEAFDDEGILKLKMVLKRGQKVIEEHEITLSGYQDTYHHDLEIVERLARNTIIDAKTQFNKKYPRELFKNKDLVDEKLLGITAATKEELSGAKVEYEIALVDNFTGSVNVKVKITKGQAKKEKQITVGGFQALNDKTSGEVRTWFMDFIQKQTTSRTNDMPTDIGAYRAKVTLKDLGLEELYIPDNWVLNIEIYATDDVAGNVRTSFTILKDGATFVLGTITILRGFLTALKAVEAVIAQLPDEVETSIKDMLPYDYHMKFRRPKDLATVGIDIKIEHHHSVKVTYEIIYPNNTRGSAILRVHATHALAYRLKNVTVVGLKKA